MIASEKRLPRTKPKDSTQGCTAPQLTNGQLKTQSNSVRLLINGSIPSFKTQKRGTISKTKAGKVFARTITRRDHKKRMAEIIRAIELQLTSLWQAEAAIQTGSSLPCWIASSVPQNDSAAWIAELRVIPNKGPVNCVEILIEKV